MAQYDPQILQTFANKLYSRATSIIVVCTVVGLIVGLVAGLFIGAGFPSGMAFIVGIVAVLGGALGYAIGSDRAFHLKFNAQLALCQRQIELNTRTRSETASAPPLQ